MGSGDAAPTASGRTRFWGNALLAAVSVGLTLVAAEAAMRIARGGLGERPVSAADWTSKLGFRGGYPAAYDEQLGYVPRPGDHSAENIWKRVVTIDADGLRSNGAPRPAGRPLLVLGDSFTFGDEVDDADTWPAQLESHLGRPVLNAGVFGYGVDQMVLRAERLLAGAAADADPVILNLLPEDVLRCEFSYRYSWKPYYEIRDDRLVLRNVPVPLPHQGPPGESGLRRAMRHSFVGDLLFRFVDPDGWGVPETLRVHDDGPEVALRLVDWLITVAQGQGRELWIVIQWMPGSDREPVEPLVERARRRRVPVIELEPTLAALARERGVDALYFMHSRPGYRDSPSHMTPEGNRLVAQAIAERLGARPPDAQAAAALRAAPDGM